MYYGNALRKCGKKRNKCFSSSSLTFLVPCISNDEVMRMMQPRIRSEMPTGGIQRKMPPKMVMTPPSTMLREPMMMVPVLRLKQPRKLDRSVRPIDTLKHSFRTTLSRSYTNKQSKTA